MKYSKILTKVTCLTLSYFFFQIELATKLYVSYIHVLSAFTKKTTGTFQFISCIKYNIKEGNKKPGKLYFVKEEDYKSPVGETLPLSGFSTPYLQYAYATHFVKVFSLLVTPLCEQTMPSASAIDQGAPWLQQKSQMVKLLAFDLFIVLWSPACLLSLSLIVTLADHWGFLWTESLNNPHWFSFLCLLLFYFLLSIFLALFPSSADTA